MRNDLYITLEKGEFEKGGKTVARNVEITVYALDADGQILRVFSFTHALIKLLYINTSVHAVFKYVCSVQLLIVVTAVTSSMQYHNHASVQQI